MRAQKLRFALLALAIAALLAGKFGPPPTVVQSDNTAPQLSEKRLTHILYGDQTGGGHLHGQNVPCKSEFPANWDATKIETVVTKTAANDNLNWQQGRNGNWVAEDTVDGLRIKIVLDDERDDIITAYPTNVKRNACNKAANDN